MNRVFAVMLIATACVVGSTPSFALGGVVHLLARGEAEQSHHSLWSSAADEPRFRKPHYGATRGTIAAPVQNGPAAQSPYFE
jgi:hypothetical protein